MLKTLVEINKINICSISKSFFEEAYEHNFSLPSTVACSLNLVFFWQIIHKLPLIESFLRSIYIYTIVNNEFIEDWYTIIRINSILPYIWFQFEFLHKYKKWHFDDNSSNWFDCLVCHSLLFHIPNN